MQSSRFSYIDFVKNNIDNTNAPIVPSHLIRGAMNNGATGTTESVHRRIRMACESIVSANDYKRIRTPDIKGYQYTKAA
jgi:hypothetical protein